MVLIPVHIVTGAPRAGKSAFIARLCAERRDWLGLVNSPTSVAGMSNMKPLPAGCPCCAGKLVLQITLARALRETRAGRAFVELGDAVHLTGLWRVLDEPPFSLSVVNSRSVRLPQDAGLHAADFDR